MRTLIAELQTVESLRLVSSNPSSDGSTSLFPDKTVPLITNVMIDLIKLEIHHSPCFIINKIK